jgi:hypothetical protein
LNRPEGTRTPGGSSPIAANGRGLLLLLVAFVIGIAIFRSTDSGGVSPASTNTSPEVSTTRAGRTDTTAVPVSTTLPARSPAEVKVLPVNASGIAGVGGKAGDKLRTAGYTNTLAAVNSNSDSPSATSSIEYTAGAEADARAVATVLGLPATTVKALESPPVSDTRGAEVVVLIGGDLAATFGTATTTG